MTAAARNLPEFLKSVATSTADAVSGMSDDDHRVYFLAMLDALDWTKDDGRWLTAVSLLQHDHAWHGGDPLRNELHGLVVQIAEQARDMLDLRAEHSDRDDIQAIAREARAAVDRLHAIVYAVTAVHTLGSADS